MKEESNTWKIKFWSKKKKTYSNIIIIILVYSLYCNIYPGPVQQMH